MMQPQTPLNQPLYQNNIPFYQQAQNTDLQQNTTSYHQSIRKSAPNSNMNKRVDTLYNTFQPGQYESKDSRENHDQYEHSGYHLEHEDDRTAHDRKNHGRHGGLGHSAYRDHENRDNNYSHVENSSECKEKRSGGESRSTSKIRDRESRRDHTQERQDRRQTNNKSEDRANWKPNQAHTQSNQYKVDNRINTISIWENKNVPKSNIQEQGLRPNIPSAFGQPRPNFNHQFEFSLPQGNGQQRNQAGSVEGKLKRKLNNKEPNNATPNKKNCLRAQQQPQRFVAPPPQKSNEKAKGKKTKFEELNETQKMNKLTMWIQQAAAAVAKGMMCEGNPPKKYGPAIYKELRKCIMSRMFLIYENRYPSNVMQISAEYKDKFRLKKDMELFTNVLAKVKEERNPSVSSETSASANSTADVTADPGAGQEMIAPKPQQKIKNTELKTLNTKKIEVSAKSSVPPAPVKKSGKLPSYPNSSKKEFTKNKQEHADQFLGVSEIKLPKHLQTAMDAEMKEFDDLISQACKEVDISSGGNFKKQWVNGKNFLLRTIRIHTSKRLLNDTKYLVVRVYFTAKKPCVETLQNFLKQYGVISLKKSLRQKMFVAACSSFEGYDALLRRGETFIDGSTVTFRPLNITGPPLSREERKLRQENNDNNDDSSSDDEDELEDEIFNDHDEDCEENNENNIHHIINKQEKNDDRIEARNEETHDETKVTEIKNNEGTKLSNDNDFHYTCTTVENIEQVNKISVGDEEKSNGIVVGDNNYVVLDDLDDINKKNEEIHKADNVAMEEVDIAEDELEDF